MGEELDGLDLEERKCKRVGPIFNDVRDVSNLETNFTDSDLSKSDCSEFNKHLLATLAKQASQPL